MTRAAPSARTLRLPIDVAGTVHVVSDRGVRVALHAAGARLSATVRTRRDLLVLWRSARSSGARLTRGLALLDTELRLLVGDREIARLGPHTRGNLLGRLCGWPDARVSAWALLGIGRR